MAADAPRLIRRVLAWPPVWFLARLLLVSAYLVGAAAKLADWPGVVAEQAYFGMTPPAFWAALTIAVEIAGPLLILTGRFVWLGAGMLGVFTLLAAIKANAFWTMAAPERSGATNAFFEHLGLVGAFILIAMIAAYSRHEETL